MKTAGQENDHDVAAADAEDVASLAEDESTAENTVRSAKAFSPSQFFSPLESPAAGMANSEHGKGALLTDMVKDGKEDEPPQLQLQASGA